MKKDDAGEANARRERRTPAESAEAKEPAIGKRPPERRWTPRTLAASDLKREGKEARA
jgi:hypothetical protein